jgi:hypothetical protein
MGKPFSIGVGVTAVLLVHTANAQAPKLPPVPQGGTTGMMWALGRHAYLAPPESATSDWHEDLNTGIWPHGGEVPLSRTKWRCWQSGVSWHAAGGMPGHKLSSQTVNLECAYKGASVKSFVTCEERRGEFQRTSLHLTEPNGRFVVGVTVTCSFE